MTTTYPTVTRSAGDTSPITFSWPSDDASIEVERSINGAAFEDAAGAISFLRSENGLHFFQLAHAAADRPADATSVLFRLSDLLVTRLLPLSIEPAVDCGGGTEYCECDDEVTPLLDPDTIGEAMAAPARMTVEGNTFEQHSLSDQIAADKYRRSLIAAEQPTSKRMRIGRFTPPGTT